MREKITDALVRSAEAPADRPTRLIGDTQVKGFGLCVTRAGARAFVVRYRIDARARQLTIGSYPDWTVTAGREETRSVKRLDVEDTITRWNFDTRCHSPPPELETQSWHGPMREIAHKRRLLVSH